MGNVLQDMGGLTYHRSLLVFGFCDAQAGPAREDDGSA